MRVVITGGSGQLGKALSRLAPASYDIVALSARECDATDLHAVMAALERYEPELIVHAGAMTDVDRCEREPTLAYQVNALGTQNIAAAAQTIGARLLYVSTNYVFSGEDDGPYHEFAETAPISIYGHSKLAGEAAVRSLCPRHYIVRTSMVYDETGRNFVNTMLRLAGSHPRLTVVADQVGNPTYAGDLAAAIWELTSLPAFGTYHLTNSGVTSWHGWATEIFDLSGITIKVNPIQASDYQRDAQPPTNGALANTAAAALGITLPAWRDGLRRCLDRRAEVSAES